MIFLFAAASAAPPKAPRLEPWKGDPEVELFSAVITAASCARALADTGDLDLVWACSPAETATTGFALYDPVDGGVYLLAPDALPLYELEAGFGGAMDVEGRVIGARDGVPVIEPAEYTVKPKPKPGAFKGCL